MAAQLAAQVDGTLTGLFFVAGYSAAGCKDCAVSDQQEKRVGAHEDFFANPPASYHTLNILDNARVKALAVSRFVSHGGQDRRR